MKTHKNCLIVAFFLLLGLHPNLLLAGRTPYPVADSTSWWQPILASTANGLESLENEYLHQIEPLQFRLKDLNQSLQDPRNRVPECGFPMLWEKMQLQETLVQLEQEHELKLLKLRYRKSIEIVKMLYEKVLSMDHHLSSLKAQQGLSNLSNPHNYPEFKEAKNIVEERMKRKFNFQMPALLQTNPYISAAFSIVGFAVGGGEEKEKKESIEKVACVLDFTVRMHNDLNVIYYETGYLREANLTLKKECESLFSDCARQVGYTIPLISCRDGDDWERLYGMLDVYVSKALGEIPANNNGMPAIPDPRLLSRATTNLQFSIDRVGSFIDKYSNFVSQGGEYYKKFSKIAGNYENEKTCAASLPDQFKQLKNDIDETLEKFNSAYKMPEVQGSKLKDMLYGTAQD
ncbi:MAG: hypothetical protein J0M29_16185 [Chitinophagales bacterium]|nr:hypothetical protein [Chitinophagales bacterium]